MSRSNLIYSLALITAVAFVLSIVGGLVFWLGGSGGIQGGGGSGGTILNFSRGTWSDLHTWFSLVVAAGALIHLALHWKWIVRMTRRYFGSAKPPRSGRVRLFYALDAVIGLSFVLTMLTGLVFFVLGSGGYQGGRNPAFQTAFWGLSRGTWSDLHTWFGLVMTAAIVVHVGFHWSWIVSKSKRLLRGAPSDQLVTQPAGE